MAALLLGVVLGIVMPLQRGLRGLIAITRRIASGDLLTPVATRAPGDLRDLGDAIETMRGQLQQKIAQHEQDSAALRTSDNRYRALFNHSPVPMWVIDPDTQSFLDVNDAMVALHGSSRDELLGMRITDLESHAEGVSRFQSKRGGFVELELTSHMLVIEGRQGVLTVGLDVTFARRAEAQLRHAQKMEAIGQLAGGISHDFNNLLAVIQLNAESIAAELGPEHHLAEEVEDIVAAAQRGARLTRQLLAFSRKQEVRRKPIDLNATVRALHGTLGGVLGENLELSLNLAPDIGAIVADPGQIEQLLLDLVLNARDAMSGGGTITIETSDQVLDQQHAAQIGVKPGCHVALTVTDTGCGMDRATQARVFEPFFTTKEVGKGSGLGLSNVFAIVTNSSGGVVVDSEPGQGATFQLYFPRVGDPLEPTLPSAPNVMRGGTETILIVDDNPQLRAATRRLVDAWGYRCLEAESGDAALALINGTKEHIDLVLSDVVMPGQLDGRALAAHVKRSWPEIKVVLMSGYTEHAAVKTTTTDDVTLVQKPFTSATLSAAIRDALDSPSRC